jgi:hypothetical protein
MKFQDLGHLFFVDYLRGRLNYPLDIERILVLTVRPQRCRPVI